ncbi:MAG: hypothetical protein QNI90_01505 [Dinoroseobacter sp.]|nr:hypothetical protein [Dinoroseobacter sp.]
MRSISLLFIVLFIGLPMLWYVPAMIWGYQVTKEAMDPEAGLSADLVGGPAPLQWMKKNGAMHAYFSPDELTDRREVSFELELELAEVLAPGEAAPAPDLQDLYVKARAPAFLIGYCEEILGPLATKCDVADSDGWVSREGRARINGSLAYIPAYNIGNIGEVENGEIMSASARIFTGSDMVSASAESRQVAIMRALELCEQVRAKLGNCVISDLSITQTRQRHMKEEVPTRISSYARVAVYADKTVYRTESLKAEIAAIWDDLIN